MAKKKGKVSKKKPSAIQAFDLECINMADLKKYVVLLERELALMRKECAYYSTKQEKIIGLLNTRKSVALSQNHTSAINNLAEEEFIGKMERLPEKNNEKTVINERETVRNKLKSTFDAFVIKNTGETNHLYEEHFLKRQIEDKDKLLELDQLRSKMTIVDSKESCHSMQEHIDLIHSQKLESLLQQSISQCLEANQGFSSDKTKLLISIWDIQDCETRESYRSEMKRMQRFFFELWSNNNEMVRILRERLENLIIENKKIRLNLEQTMQQNAKLQAALQPMGFLPSSSETIYVGLSNCTENAQKQNHLDRLQFRNDVFQQQLRVVKENSQDLKKQFVSATRKIYQKAEFKAHMLEEVIKLNLQTENLQLAEKQPESREQERVRKHQIEEEKDDMVNVFSLRVENSDKLFVPPVYHEFWDLSIKFRK